MSKNVNKELTTSKLVTTIVVLLLIGTAVIFLSGLLDSPQVASHQHNSANTQTGGSVDMNAINQINELENIVKNNPTNHEALLQLGHLLNDNGFYQRAIPKYEQYLKDHPNNVDVIVDMGVCYFEMKQYDKSLSVIKDAIKIDPKHQIAHFNLGIVSFAKNDIEAAKEWWQKANEINPNSNIGKKAEELLKSN